MVVAESLICILSICPDLSEAKVSQAIFTSGLDIKFFKNGQLADDLESVIEHSVQH